MSDLTAKDLAIKFGVEKRVAQGWIQRGMFPNAYKEANEFVGEVWRVPAKDLEGFDKPSAGRPKKEKKTA